MARAWIIEDHHLHRTSCRQALREHQGVGAIGLVFLVQVDEEGTGGEGGEEQPLVGPAIHEVEVGKGTAPNTAIFGYNGLCAMA